ncbi:MAG: 50S ribosomal protein L24 [Candidatus Kerfeldbacteria bacterium RIFCSPHIGHO2_12_FULL_48_17]|uniref:Large ribosomal subunit protein uL24 n=1 Tax=Candidatus Kerfeldbacteria bacterium RIFCSPHIGHO2_12_FULL_48_17 TaxID=1798542 RepID=A0A1G2B4Y6_9BACT|nr:MAG: 50S ribosomal protein L24 [Candidatus Kerfeldbacteria bacterium RIFCSPHIGHO2_12_FULL_48_17]
MKLKVGDKVKVLSGKDKGKTGKITQVFPALEKLVVEGVNKTIKHMKKQATRASKGQAQAGEKIEFFAPIHVSNVALVDPKTNKTTRVGFSILEDKRKVRIAKKTKQTIEAPKSDTKK